MGGRASRGERVVGAPGSQSGDSRGDITCTYYDNHAGDDRQGPVGSEGPATQAGAAAGAPEPFVFRNTIDELNRASARGMAFGLRGDGFYPTVVKVADPARGITGKEAIGTGWGTDRITEEQIARRFRDNPGAGVGICLGPGKGPGGSWLVDIEGDGPRAEESRRKLMGSEPSETIGWPSARGKHDLFMADPARIAPIVEKLGGIEDDRGIIKVPELPDLELRVGGFKRDGQPLQFHSVLPPTVGTNGQPRRFIGVNRIAPLPRAAYEFLERLADAKRGAGRAATQRAAAGGGRRKGFLAVDDRAFLIERARACVLAMAPAISGQGGSKQTLGAAQALVVGFLLADEEAWAIFQEFNEAKCIPRWDEVELRHKFEDAHTHAYQGTPGDLRDRPNPNDNGHQTRPHASRPDTGAVPAGGTNEADAKAGAQTVETQLGGGHHYEEHDGHTFLVTEKTIKGMIVPCHERIAQFTVRIIEQINIHVGDEIIRHYRVRAATREGKVAEATMPAAEFQAMKWVASMLGGGFVVEAGRETREHFRAAIEDFSAQDGIPQIDRYRSTGWIEHEGRHYYLHAGGTIGADGPSDAVQVEPTPAIEHYRLPAPPTSADRLHEVIRACLGILGLARSDRPGSGPVAAAIISIAWRAVLSASDFVIHLTGPSGSFKSSLAKLAVAHLTTDWGGARHRLFASWDWTPNALQRLIHDLNCSLVAIDELTGSKAVATALDVVQAQGNLVGRGRMGQDFVLSANLDPRSTVLSTGEGDISRQSGLARMLCVPLGRDTIDPDILARCQREAESGIYAEGMAAYLMWMAGPGCLEAARTTHRDRVATFTAVISGAVQGQAVHPRQAGIAAELLAGFNGFLDFAVDAGAITADEAATHAGAVRGHLIELVGGQAEGQEEAKPGRRFLALLAAALSSKKYHLVVADSDDAPKTFPEACGWVTRESSWHRDRAWEIPPNSQQVGVLHEGDELVYLNPAMAEQVAAKMAAAQGRPFENPDKLRRDLAHEGLCQVKGEARKDGDINRLTPEKRFRNIGKRRWIVVRVADLFGPEKDEEEAEAKANDTI